MSTKRAELKTKLKTITMDYDLRVFFRDFLDEFVAEDDTLTNPVSTTTITVDTLVAGDITLSDTSWDDLRFPVSAIKLQGTGSEPDIENTYGTYLFDDGTPETVFIMAQMPHAWKEGTNVFPHTHWYKTTSATGDVCWQLDYIISKKGAQFSDTFTTITGVTPAIGDNDTVRTHALTPIGSSGIDMTGCGLSDHIIMKLTRKADATIDTYGADAGLLEFDIHYEIDSFGSDSEFTQ